jgi:hypothetical protein
MARPQAHALQPAPFALTETSRNRLSPSSTALAILDGFVGLTAACGAVFIVPRLSP